MLNHIAIIADGNRRWAKSKHLPKLMGYQAGLATIEKCCEWAIENQIAYLTIYCFSTENWNRSNEEVQMIMNLGKAYLTRQNWYIDRGIKVQFYGRDNYLDQDLLKDCRHVEKVTSQGTNLTLTICLDYGGRNEILEATKKDFNSIEELAQYFNRYFPDPDIIIRTGGQYRLSNFLLWQAAYAELFFIEDLFPNLNGNILNQIIKDFNNRIRNYGK